MLFCTLLRCVQCLCFARPSKPGLLQSSLKTLTMSLGRGTQFSSRNKSDIILRNVSTGKCLLNPTNLLPNVAVWEVYARWRERKESDIFGDFGVSSVGGGTSCMGGTCVRRDPTCSFLRGKGGIWGGVEEEEAVALNNLPACSAPSRISVYQERHALVFSMCCVREGRLFLLGVPK